MADDSNPIVVNADPTGAQLGAALRYAVTMVGGYLVGRGWLDSDLLSLIVAVLTAIAPVAYAMWRARQQTKLKVRLADAAPDSLAVVSGDSA